MLDGVLVSFESSHASTAPRISRFFVFVCARFYLGRVCGVCGLLNVKMKNYHPSHEGDPLEILWMHVCIDES